MIKMHKKFFEKTANNSRGFSLIEVLLGISVFMIGMLGVTALNISSLKSNTFSGNLSEAVNIAGDKIEDLMVVEFEHDDLKDTDGDGTDEDLLPAISVKIFGDGIDDNGGNFGLDDTGTGAGEADKYELGVGRNDMYNIYWNVAIDEPLPEKTKKVNVIVEWYAKDQKRTISISSIILDHGI